MILSEKEVKRLRAWKRKHDRKPPEVCLEITVCIIRRKSGECKIKKIVQIVPRNIKF